MTSSSPRFVHAIIAVMVLAASAAYAHTIAPTDEVPKIDCADACSPDLPFVGDHVGLVGADLGAPRAVMGAAQIDSDSTASLSAGLDAETAMRAALVAVADGDFMGAADVLIAMSAPAEPNTPLVLESKRHSERWDRYLVEDTRERSVDRVGLHVAQRSAPTLLN